MTSSSRPTVQGASAASGFQRAQSGSSVIGTTHVSFAPPFWDELTTSAPSSSATRVMPPGRTRASPGAGIRT